MNKRIIIYIIAIIIILVAIFFSQQAVSSKVGKNLISGATAQTSAIMAKGSNLGISSAYSKISESIQSGGEMIINEINQAQQKISDTQKNISNYFSGISNSILHPGENNNCAVPTTK